ncbi:MAG: type I restriction enzyme HsdR N-terminal domain-containing protein [Proteobacteria bacterium]|nr:type I restriction enzyme HsdR N-terminal domain-containing protein [Pseudomonadota bacterium]
MGSLPAKASTRIVAALKKFKPIITAARAKDVNESDTVVIVTDLLQEMFGYDKYNEITSEHVIRGTSCDLAIKVEDAIVLLIEVKAIGLELKDQHVKQAVDYAANQGCDWVVLTNGIFWRIYKVTFGKPIEKELVVELNMLELNPRSDDDIELVGLLAREAWQKERLGEYLEQKQALSRFTIAAVLLSDTVLAVVRRELRRVSPEVHIDVEEIANALRTDVLKREALDGEKAQEAQKRVARSANTTLRDTKEADSGDAKSSPDSKS